MPGGAHLPSKDDIGLVLISGEPVHIPWRIYSTEPALPSTVSDLQRTIVACLYTRHHNGFIREKYLSDLFRPSYSWIPPFVLQLVGEYVLEIVELINRNMSELEFSVYKRFANENKEFVALTRARVISYWDCYYRQRRWKFRNYTPFRILDRLGLWEGPDAKRVLKHQQRLSANP